MVDGWGVTSAMSTGAIGSLGFNPCCGGWLGCDIAKSVNSSYAAAVSILVVVDGWGVTSPPPPAWTDDGLVSILVVVDGWGVTATSLSSVTISVCFNPCCGGWLGCDAATRAIPANYDEVSILVRV